MIAKVLNTIEKNKMILDGEKIIVGVSGGPDSMCLLHILNSLKEKYHISIVAAHVNHCLRGAEADKDQQYVKDFCENNDIEFYFKKVDVDNIAKTQGISCEMAGREVRYAFFNELMNQLGGNKIAIAHNANDQCETVLMRIMRGTGIEGLAGIKAIRDNIYIRPLIDITRDEIESYCEENNLKPRIDKTNLETIYTRNKIRLELIPYIKKNFNEDIINSVNRLSENVTVDNEYIDYMTCKTFEKYSIVEKELVILKKEIFDNHMAIVSRVIRKAIENINGSLYNYERKHIYDIVALQQGETGKSIMLPKEIIALNNYGDIHIGKEKAFVINKDDRSYNLSMGKNSLDCGLDVTLEVIDNDESLILDDDKYTKYFDYSKIDGTILLRYRKQGDKFLPLGMKGRKKIKDLFIDLKIPREKRESIPLICFGNEISWIIGYKISDIFKVTNSANKILKIKIESR